MAVMALAGASCATAQCLPVARHGHTGRDCRCRKSALEAGFRAAPESFAAVWHAAAETAAP